MATVSDDEWEQVPSTSTVNRVTDTADSSQKRSATRKPVKSPQAARVFYKAVRDHAYSLLQTYRSHIFVTNIDYREIRQAYLDNLPAEFNCSTCRAFIKRVGNLALVDHAGHLIPLFWPAKVSTSYEKATGSIRALFQDAKVVTEYKVHTLNVGCAEKGGFHHFYMDLPGSRLAQPVARGVSVLNTSEAASMLARVLADFSSASVNKAVQALGQHKLPNANNHYASARWLQDLLANHPIPREESTVRHNLLYRYAATAYTGCLNQLRSGPLSILLSNIEANKPWEETKAQWTALTGSENYMRPKALPTSGNVAATERLFNDLGLTADDTRRRFLCTDEIPTKVYLWRRKPAKKASDGLKIFNEILTKPINPKALDTSNDLPATSISFTKLITQILPTASRVWVHLHKTRAINFMITGLEGTKPLLQWHTDTNRVSSYVYTHPKPISTHGLHEDNWNEVHGLVSAPWLWDVHDKIAIFPRSSDDELRKPASGLSYVHTKTGMKYVFLLDGVYDKSAANLCLFPEWVRGELHGVRKTIEQFSSQGSKEVPEGIEGRGGYVGGVSYGRGVETELLVRTEGGMEGVWRVVCFD